MLPVRFRGKPNSIPGSAENNRPLFAKANGGENHSGLHMELQITTMRPSESQAGLWSKNQLQAELNLPRAIARFAKSRAK
jgi:hypothetical protein